MFTIPAVLPILVRRSPTYTLNPNCTYIIPLLEVLSNSWGPYHPQLEDSAPLLLGAPNVIWPGFRVLGFMCFGV